MSQHSLLSSMSEERAMGSSWLMAVTYGNLTTTRLSALSAVNMNHIRKVEKNMKTSEKLQEMIQHARWSESELLEIVNEIQLLEDQGMINELEEQLSELQDIADTLYQANVALRENLQESKATREVLMTRLESLEEEDVRKERQLDEELKGPFSEIRKRLKGE